MADVHNWQIGRTMDYPHEESFPDRQFAFVFNINRCIGCQTCTMACKSTWTFSKGQEYMWWNNVETKPFGGYPQNWDKKILEMLEEKNPGNQVWNASDNDADLDPSGEQMKPYGTFEGKTIFEALDKSDPDQPQNRVLGYEPSDDEWKAPNIYEDTAFSGSGRNKNGRMDPDATENEEGRSAELPEHGTWFFYLQRICNHCTYPACLAACPRNAIYKRDEDGVVLIDQERCRGYRECVSACPYKKSMYRPNTQVSEKCIGCYPRLEGKDPELSPEGNPVETRCMSACVGKIRMQGLVAMDDQGNWVHDPDNPIYYMVKEEKVALPLYPQFGTAPNGFYIPPRWVDREYLEQMFGPGVEQAIERYVNPSRRLRGLLQLFRAAQQVIFSFEIEEGEKIAEAEVTLPSGKTTTQEIYNDTAIGYNQAGDEIVRVNVKERRHERPKEHYNSY